MEPQHESIRSTQRIHRVHSRRAYSGHNPASENFEGRRFLVAPRKRAAHRCHNLKIAEPAARERRRNFPGTKFAGRYGMPTSTIKTGTIRIDGRRVRPVNCRLNPEEITHGHRPLAHSRSSVTRWYHCVTRCVRRAFLLGEAGPNSTAKNGSSIGSKNLRKSSRLSVGGFSVMDNHLHVLVRLDPEIAAGWSDEEVVRRWGRLFPPRDKTRQPLPVSKSLGQVAAAKSRVGGDGRERLQSLSWFMKCLKEPLSRLANRQDRPGAHFSRGGSKAWRSSTKNRCWPPAPTSI